MRAVLPFKGQTCDPRLIGQVNKASWQHMRSENDSHWSAGLQKGSVGFYGFNIGFLLFGNDSCPVVCLTTGLWAIIFYQFVLVCFSFFLWLGGVSQGAGPHRDNTSSLSGALTEITEVCFDLFTSLIIIWTKYQLIEGFGEECCVEGPTFPWQNS